MQAPFVVSVFKQLKLIRFFRADNLFICMNGFDGSRNAKKVKNMIIYLSEKYKKT